MANIYPPAPFVAPVSGDIVQRLSQVAEAINKKADVTAEPTYSAVLLVASNGSVWRLTVDSAGALHTASVPR